MGIVVDSTILIAAERGKLDLDALLRGYVGERIVLASISASELLHGVHRARVTAQHGTRAASVERVLSTYPLIDFDLDIARVHADVGAVLASRGIAVGAHDLIIAATALFLGYQVATRDEKSFPRIPGLTILRW